LMQTMNEGIPVKIVGKGVDYGTNQERIFARALLEA